MKNMKRIISAVLLMCMIAALMCVPAFADFAPGDTVTLTATHTQLDGNSPDTIVRFTASLQAEFVNPFYVMNKTVVWYKNGAQVASKPLNADGTCIAEFKASAFNEGTNTMQAVIQDGADTLSSNTVTLTKSAAITSVPANTEFTLNTYSVEIANDASQSARLYAYFNGVNDNSKVIFRSSDPSVAAVGESSGLIQPKSIGTATITAYLRENSAVSKSCTVQVVPNHPEITTTVYISPIPTDLQKGQTVNISASVTGSDKKAVFSHWHVDSQSAAYISLGYDKSDNTTLTARAATSTPVRLYAFAQDGTSTYVEFTISAPQSLKIDAYPANIKNGEVSTVYVTNGFTGEEFTWSITPSANYGVLSRSNNLGSSVELTAGPVEGRITVTATSKADATRTSTVTVYVNSEANYGGASITPAVASWSAGQGALKFEVSPAYYKAYVDGKLLTPTSGYYTYYGGVLTLNTSLLSSLSSGEHSLKVYTSSDNGIDGLVYATIYITGSASSVYGDNAHVRGSGYNLYFNSTDPIREVYISNQWIDPANYSVDGSGTRLTLNSDFLNKLGYGSYTMKLVTQNGYTETTSFRIVTANYAPATGDDSNIGVWMMLLALSCAGAVALIPKRKKSTDLIG